MCCFCKLIKTQKLLHFLNLIPPKLNTLLHPNTYLKDYFKNPFITFVEREWDKLSTGVCNTTSYEQLRKLLLSFIKQTSSSLFSIHHPVGFKLLVRLRIGSGHMRAHKFRHNFDDILNPLCSCSLESETTSHYFLYCHNFSSVCSTLTNGFDLLDPTNCQLNQTALANIIIYGDSKKGTSQNIKVLQRTIKYISATKPFDESLCQRSHLHVPSRLLIFTLVLSWRHIICGVKIRSLLLQG